MSDAKNAMPVPAGGMVHGQVALVTGGADGIGEATVRLLVAEGAAVVVADINRMRGEQLVAELSAQGHKAGFVHTDVTQERDIEAAIGLAVHAYGRLDIMVKKGAPASNPEWRCVVATRYFRTCPGMEISPMRPYRNSSS